MSSSAELTLCQETTLTPEDVKKLADYTMSPEEIGAKPASGSFKTEGMLIVPCSMKTIAGIHSGYADNLILRAADVTIKEQRTLVLAARETPLSGIHLRNLYELSMRMTPKDLLISFSFSRYSSDAVLIAQNADMSGVPHVAFADTMLSPVAAKADLTMVCEVDSCNNVPSLTGAVGLISLVLTGCGQRHREKAQEHMKRVEGFLSENHLLYTPDGQC